MVKKNLKIKYCISIFPLSEDIYAYCVETNNCWQWQLLGYQSNCNWIAQFLLDYYGKLPLLYSKEYYPYSKGVFLACYSNICKTREDWKYHIQKICSVSNFLRREDLILQVCCAEKNYTHVMEQNVEVYQMPIR